MKLFILIPLAFMISGCCETKPNQEKRHKIFMECLDKIKFAPTNTHYNDMDEVVESCESAAYYQSLERKCE